MFTNQSNTMSPLARRCLIFVVTNNRGLSILLVGATHWLNNQCHVSIQIWGTSPPVAKYISRWKVDPLCSKKFIKKTVIRWYIVVPPIFCRGSLPESCKPNFNRTEIICPSGAVRFFRHYIMSSVLVPRSPSFIVMTRFVEIRQHMLAWVSHHSFSLV